VLAVLLGAVVDRVDGFRDQRDLGIETQLPLDDGVKALLDELPVFALCLLGLGVAADEAVLDEPDEPHEDEHAADEDGSDGYDADGGSVVRGRGAQDEPHEEEGGTAGRCGDAGGGFRGGRGVGSWFRHSGTPSGRCTDSECASTSFQNT